MARAVRVGIVLLVLVFLFSRLYPLYLQYPQRRSTLEITERYARMLESLTQAELQGLKDAVHAANEGLGEIRLGDVYSGYGMGIASRTESLLQLTGNGNIAVLSIPGQEVWLPVYPGDSSSGMEHGVIHVPGSSLPEGESGDGHVVLAGHLGLEADTLFGSRKVEARLDALREMEGGDMLYLYVLGEVACYRVETIRTISFHQVGLLTWPQTGGYLSVMADEGD